MSTAIFTSCDLRYLDRAIVLAESVKKYNNDVSFCLMLSDFFFEEYFTHPAFAIFDHIITTAEIGIPDFERWVFGLDVVELCTAVKGYCIEYIFNLGYVKVLYLDPDIACFSSLNFLIEQLDTHGPLLTPHRLNPSYSKSDFEDNELSIFRHGIYNLGFLGVNSMPECRKFVKWWQNRLLTHCIDDIPNGIFTDQKWCDASPAFFPSTKIIHHPGCNVASWNLAEREIVIQKNTITVNESFELIFYHFTKFTTVGRAMTTKYMRSLDVLAIWDWYGKQIKHVRSNLPRPDRHGLYQHYENGQPITGEDRALFRKSPSVFNSNPFQGKR